MFDITNDFLTVSLLVLAGIGIIALIRHFNQKQNTKKDLFIDGCHCHFLKKRYAGDGLKSVHKRIEELLPGEKTEVIVKDSKILVARTYATWAQSPGRNDRWVYWRISVKK